MVPKLRICNAEPARRGSAAAAFLLFLPMAATTGRSVPALVVVAIMAVFAVSELSGVLASYYDADHEVAYFGILAAAAILVGLIVWVLAPRISRLMEGVH